MGNPAAARDALHAAWRDTEMADASRSPVAVTERLAVVHTPGKGRGVVARTAFAVGDVVEVSPVLVIRDGDALDPTELANYVYNWPTSPGAVAVAFGFGSLFNHSYTPNLRYHKEPSPDGGGVVRFTALCAIAAGDELLINYNGDPTDRSPMWFPTDEPGPQGG
jgi:hypothetical protein